MKVVTKFMGLNKNKILGWATLIMIIMGCLLVGLAIYRYADIAGWGFGAVGVGFFSIAWVFNALKRQGIKISGFLMRIVLFQNKFKNYLINFTKALIS